jgi:hypothetical protein
MKKNGQMFGLGLVSVAIIFSLQGFRQAGTKTNSNAPELLKVAKTSLSVGVGEIQEIAVVGTLFSKARVTSSDPLILEVEKSTWGFFARAKRPGDGFITVSANGTTRQVSFVVRPLAAKLPESLSVAVSGKPALSGTIKGAIESALKLRTNQAPLSKLTYTLDNVPSLGSGLTLNVPVRVKVTAPGTITQSSLINVKVTNIGLTPLADESLWYCNDPERITKPGNLFAANLGREKSSRLLYHHINDTSKGIIVRCLVLNDSDVTARVLLIPGDSSPDKDPVGAGMRAGDVYMRGWMNGSGEVVTIPPHCSIPVSFRRLAPQQIISGLCTVRLIDGPDTILVRNDAFPPVEVEPRWRATLSSSTPWREVGPQTIKDWDRSPYELSDHVYPNPYRTEEIDFKIGERERVVRLGQKSIVRQDSSGRLDGNFGVVYEINALLTNPQTESATVEVVFETSAGYSGGLFFVNDDYVVTPKMLPKAQARVGRYRLAAGATQRVKITTLPLSGSSYPATLFFRTFSETGSSSVINLVGVK